MEDSFLALPVMAIASMPSRLMEYPGERFEKTAEIREVIGDRKTTEKTADPLNAALSGDGDAMTTGSSSMNLS